MKFIIRSYVTYRSLPIYLFQPTITTPTLLPHKICSPSTTQTGTFVQTFLKPKRYANPKGRWKSCICNHDKITSDANDGTFTLCPAIYNSFQNSYNTSLNHTQYKFIAQKKHQRSTIENS